MRRELRNLARGRLLAALAIALSAGPLRAEAAGPGGIIEVDGGKLHYEECRGPDRAATLVLLHDGILHSTAWDEVWPAFCKRFHVIRYDRRGYGQSPQATGLFSPVDDLAAVLRQTKTGRATLVASSAGGGLAVDFALQHPEAVQSLVLVGATVSGFAVSDAFLIRNFLAAEKAPDNLAEVPFFIAPGNDAVRTRVADLLRANPQNLAPHNFAREGAPALPRLSRIEAATLILVGEADHPDNHAQAGALQAGIPRSRRIVLKDAGHLPYLERPDEFASSVIRFIDANTL